MNDYLERLRKELLKIMQDKGLNMTDLSIVCDVSYHSMCNIINGLSQDMNMSTFVKICENVGISYADIFNLDGSALLGKSIKKFVFTDGTRKYKLVVC